MNRDVEILAPAGSMECLRAAVAAGADAIYLGGTKFGARAYAQNLSEEDLVQAIEYVHIHGRKIYMTVNTLLKDRELNELYAYLLPYYKAGLDGVIVQDIGAVKFIGEYFPEMPVHASTQMTITNTLGADFLKRYGITRVVPARELSLKEIRDMKKQTGLEMECFVHGALCYCYSGQCLLSSMIGGRSGNRGQCAQPCRLPYQTEGKKPADLMSLKDLCTIDILPELIDAGIDIVVVKSTQNQYFIGSRLFEYPELKMLTDAVASSKIISAKKSEELVQKLCRLAGTYQAEQLRQFASLSSRVKPDNEQVYYINDAIQTAILDKRQVQFQYYEYTPEKKRVLKHGGYLYKLDPYALEWKNDHY